MSVFGTRLDEKDVRIRELESAQSTTWQRRYYQEETKTDKLAERIRELNLETNGLVVLLKAHVSDKVWETLSLSEAVTKYKELEHDRDQLRTAFVDKEPCGHTKNFLIGDDHGHFSCTVCRISDLEYRLAKAQAQNNRLEQERDAAEEALAIQRRAQADAPHSQACSYVLGWNHARQPACDCWKSLILEVKS